MQNKLCPNPTTNGQTWPFPKTSWQTIFLQNVYAVRCGKSFIGEKSPIVSARKFLSRLLPICFLALFAVGCASGVKFSEYRATVLPPPECYGRVWFYRPSAVGAAVQPAVKLDNQAIGNAVPKGFFHYETLPGTHEVSATTEMKHKTSITVTTNANTYVRLNMMMGLFVGHVLPREVPERQATNDMKNLHLITK